MTLLDPMLKLFNILKKLNGDINENVKTEAINKQQLIKYGNMDLRERGKSQPLNLHQQSQERLQSLLNCVPKDKDLWEDPFKCRHETITYH